MSRNSVFRDIVLKVVMDSLFHFKKNPLYISGCSFFDFAGQKNIARLRQNLIQTSDVYS